MNKAKGSLITMIAMAVLALTQPWPAAAEDSAVKDAAKQAGRDAKAMGKKAGKAAKEVGQGIGRASTRTFKTIKKEFRKDFLEGNAGNSAAPKSAGGRD